MKHVVVFESAKELVDFFHNTENTPPVVFLNVGSIQNSWIGLDNDDFQLAPHIVFGDLFLELCKRMGIPVKRVGGANN